MCWWGSCKYPDVRAVNGLIKVWWRKLFWLSLGPLNWYSSWGHKILLIFSNQFKFLFSTSLKRQPSMTIMESDVMRHNSNDNQLEESRIKSRCLATMFKEQATKEWHYQVHELYNLKTTSKQVSLRFQFPYCRSTKASFASFWQQLKLIKSRPKHKMQAESLLWLWKTSVDFRSVCSRFWSRVKWRTTNYC